MQSIRKDLSDLFNKSAIFLLDNKTAPTEAIPAESIKKITAYNRDEYGGQDARVISLPSIPSNGTYIQQEQAKDTGNRYRQYLDKRNIPYEERIINSGKDSEYNELIVRGRQNINILEKSLERHGVRIEGVQYHDKKPTHVETGMKPHELLIGGGIIALALGSSK